MRSAIVFAGQGSQRKGMGLEAMQRSATARGLWDTAERRMRDRYGFSMTEVVRDNPIYLHAFEGSDALRNGINDPSPNLPESAPRTRRIEHSTGVLGKTFLTQPAVVMAQIATLAEARDSHAAVRGATVFGGHSLGEFSALCAMGVFPIDVAVELVYRRGTLMENALCLGSQRRPDWKMYAVNPNRAKLATQLPDGTAVPGDDVVAYLVELIATRLRATTSWLEIVNYNTPQEQLVVAGDEVGLSVLGKVLDPLTRANTVHYEHVADFEGLIDAAIRSVHRDIRDGYNEDPNAAPLPDFVPASWHRYGRRSIFQRRMITMDDGQTLPVERLTHLTLEGDGRSGLKKKSWFVPLAVDVPFHSSHLRRAMDQFHADCLDALPSDAALAKALTEDTVWVTNLTGTPLRPAEDFRETFKEVVSSMNVGERQHGGKYASHLTDTFLAAAAPDAPLRSLVAATMAAQLAHPVLWMDVMQSVRQLQCANIIEIAPNTPTLLEMFKKSAPPPPATDATDGPVANSERLFAYPADREAINGAAPNP